MAGQNMHEFELRQVLGPSMWFISFILPSSNPNFLVLSVVVHFPIVVSRPNWPHMHIT